MIPEAQFFTLSLDALYILGFDNYFKLVNPAFEKLIGRSAEEILSKPFIEFMHPDDRLVTLNAVEECKTGIPINSLENRFQCRDGSYRWLEWTIYPALAEARIYGIGRDVTLRKQIEETQRDAEERLRMMVESVQEYAIFSLNTEGYISTWNTGAERLFGYTEDEILGQSFGIIYTAEDRAIGAPSQEMSKAAKTGRAEDVRWHLRKDSSRFFADGVLAPIYENTGALRGFTKIARDMTERKQIEEERSHILESERFARREAERASHLKDEFLLTLSHELRTPLNAILGWSHLLRPGKMDQAKIEHGLKVIERNVRSQVQLIDDLLDMSRMISGKLKLNVQCVDLISVIESALETVYLSAQAKNIRLDAVLDPLASNVSGDPVRLQQIIWNLLSNAIKFTPKGGRVEVVLQLVEAYIEISVSDTGPGIQAEFVPYVFDRFRQADSSTTRNHGGLGLGLAIVKHLVELHGGSVRLKNPSHGQGATFIIQLPLMVLKPEDCDSNTFMSAVVNSTFEDVIILVVDDEPDTRELIRVVLEECQAEVITAASARQALEILEDNQVDILISDIGMPEEDGYQFIQKVRTLGSETSKNIPAAALTAYARPEDCQHALLSGYQIHIAKPIEPSELIAVVSNLTKLIPKRQEVQL
ncbi:MULTISPECIES: PAS domain S-box protein [unclassified Nodularia (in: cyanobacteria)]|uniref:PAS domain-containing hybrid sensor histidine kinase/response regulator n=1 Tax=unclassified Nodularia (in: cyanobacteria) TaxID=2656917 RepID=UPI00187FF86D|nr:MULTISPECIES: PAS domain S-box protein [unclassified Nodularia (in: cyanobacteria)]MBE9201290.1 PAS domain S-box protein [Nodularia sp. LEGE 06071]MCC2695788.1 PAS domain S-box protein [Nodularia sp. LEGE 04288]